MIKLAALCLFNERRSIHGNHMKMHVLCIFFTTFAVYQCLEWLCSCFPNIYSKSYRTSLTSYTGKTMVVCSSATGPDSCADSMYGVPYSVTCSNFLHSLLVMFYKYGLMQVKVFLLKNVSTLIFWICHF